RCLRILGGGAPALPEVAEPSNRERIPAGQPAAPTAGGEGQGGRADTPVGGGRPEGRAGRERPSTSRRRERRRGGEGPRRSERRDGREGVQDLGREVRGSARAREANLSGSSPRDRGLERGNGPTGQGPRRGPRGHGGDPGEGGGRASIRGPRRRDRPRKEGVEAERENPPGTPLLLVLEGPIPHPVREEPEPGRGPDRGPSLPRPDRDGEQRLPERARFHERRPRYHHGGPDLRLDEGGPGGGGPPEDRGGDGRGHDEGREPDRTSARRHREPGLREGEERARPEP